MPSNAQLQQMIDGAVRRALREEIKPLDERLAKIEEIEDAQLAAAEASNAARLAAVKSLGSGLAQACDSLGSAAANPRVQVGLVIALIVWLAGKYALQLQYGDLIVGGKLLNEVEEVLQLEEPAPTDPEPLP
jgi:hypothetical protein